MHVRALLFFDVNLMYIAVDPVFDRLRTHPRFKRLLADIGLAPPLRAGSTTNDR